MLEAAAPTVTEYVLAGHILQEVEAEFDENVPAMQSMQLEEVLEPVAALKVPAGQLVHEVDDAREYRPAAQLPEHAELVRPGDAP